jgi:hypothetical protein
MAEAVVRVAKIEAFKSASGNVRYVLRDGDGREYVTFREEIARTALAAEGKRARITFHEQQRGRFTNVYLDGVEVVDHGDSGQGEPVEEVAWKTAMDAAPWLVGGDPEEPIPPDELFERLQPFKERVADDIRSAQGDDPT